jgi:RNA polymerase sigma-70 factor (ECF subfamily)
MERHQMSDEQLVALFAEGNNSAIELLIQRHKRRIFSHIQLLVKDKNLAEDFFQDTFIKAIKSIKEGRYQDEGHFVSWIQRIAHNLVIDYFRKQKNYKELSNDNGEYDLFNNVKFCNEPIEDEIVKKQTSAQIRDFVKLLPEEQRQLVVMRVFLDMSFKEIAESTGVSINTALGRMRYAIINIRKMMKESKQLAL